MFVQIRGTPFQYSKMIIEAGPPPCGDTTCAVTVARGVSGRQGSVDQWREVPEREPGGNRPVQISLLALMYESWNIVKPYTMQHQSWVLNCWFHDPLILFLQRIQRSSSPSSADRSWAVQKQIFDESLKMLLSCHRFVSSRFNQWLMVGPNMVDDG